MSKIILINTIYPGSLDTGGNRAHASIRNCLEKFHGKELKVISIALSEKENLIPKNSEIIINRSIDLTRYLKLVKEAISPNDIVVCDGCLATVFLFLAKLRYGCGKKYVTINHNNEFDLHSPAPRLVYGQIQRLMTSRSAMNIWFSERDRLAFRDEQKGVTCIPFAQNEFSETRKTFGHIRSNDIKSARISLSDYAAIPSNLGYIENRRGLEKFYKIYRKKFKDINIIISSPPSSEIDPEIIFLTKQYGDQVINFETRNDYYSFLINARVIILPIFSGSGIQLKALDAFLSGRPVISSLFVKDSHRIFSEFKNIDEGLVFEDYTSPSKSTILRQDMEIESFLLDTVLRGIKTLW